MKTVPARMNCHVCRHGEHRVLRTEERPSEITRTRECLQCGARWKTAEMPIAQIERANDIIEAFQRLKGVVGASTLSRQDAVDVLAPGGVHGISACRERLTTR